MLHRYSLATTKQLDLPLLLSSIPSFLLPSFNFSNSFPSPARAAPSQAGPSTEQSNSHVIFRDAIDTVSLRGDTVKEEKGLLRGVKIVNERCSRDGTSIVSLDRRKDVTLSGRMNASLGKRSYSTAVVDRDALSGELQVEKEQEGGRTMVLGGESTIAQSKGKGRVLRLENSSDDKQEEKVSTPDIDRTPLLHPPLPVGPLDPSPLLVDSPDPLSITSPPMTRKELMLFLSKLPSNASSEYLLSVRALIIRLHRLDDLGPTLLLANVMIKCNQEAIGIRFLKEAVRERTRAVSLPSALPFFEPPLRKLIQAQKWRWVADYAQTAISLGGISAFVLKSRMRALFEEKRYAQIIDTFALFSKHRIEPDGEVFDEVLGAYLMTGDLAAGQKALATKEQWGFETTVRTCIILLDGMWGFGGNRTMEEKVLNDVLRDTLKKGKALRQDVRVLNRIMSVRAARGDVQDALNVLEYYDPQYIPDWILRSLALSSSSVAAPSPPSFHPNVAHLPSPTSRMLPSTRGWKPLPDISTFATLITLAIRRNRYDSAISIFLHSQKLGLGLNEFIVNALVKVVLARDSVATAEEFVFKLPLGKTKLSPLAQDCVGVPFEPTALIYETLLHEVLKARGLQGANELLIRIMEEDKRNMEVTEGMVDSLVAYICLEVQESPSTAANFILKIQEITRGKRKPTIRNLNVLLEAAWRKQRFPSPSRKKVIPISDTPSTVNAGPRLPSGMSKIRTSLQHRGVQNNRRTAQHVLRNDKAFTSITSMWSYLDTQLGSQGILPTYKHIAIIIRAYLREADIQGARATIVRAKEMGVAPHVAMYSTLIAGATKLGHHDLVNELQREMRREGLVADRSMYAAMTYNSAKRGDLESVDRIIDEASRKLSPTLSPLDPIFASLRYRALVAAQRPFQAQIYMATMLEQGMKPDAATLKALKTSKDWLRRKLAMEKHQGRTLMRLDRAFQRNKANVVLVLGMLREQKRQEIGQRELLERVLEAGVKDHGWVT